MTPEERLAQAQEAVALHPLTPKEPLRRERDAIARRIADQIAAEFALARGWDITGWEVQQMTADYSEAVLREYGRACLASGRVR